MEADFSSMFMRQVDPFFDGDLDGSYYQGGKRQAALEQVLHLGQYGSEVLVVYGRPGVGKTQLRYALAAQLNVSEAYVCVDVTAPSDTRALQDLIFTAAGDRDLETWLASFGLTDGIPDVRAWLLIDHAELLQPDALVWVGECLQRHPTLTIVLFTGDSAVIELLGDAPVTIIDLMPLNPQETAEYLKFRLALAGVAQVASVFSLADIRRIHQQSEGLPKLINELARERWMARSEAAGERSPRRSRLPQASFIVGGVGVFLLTVAGLWMLYGDSDQMPQQQVVPLQLGAVTGPVAAEDDADLARAEGEAGVNPGSMTQVDSGRPESVSAAVPGGEASAGGRVDEVAEKSKAPEMVHSDEPATVAVPDSLALAPTVKAGTAPKTVEAKPIASEKKAPVSKPSTAPVKPPAVEKVVKPATEKKPDAKVVANKAVVASAKKSVDPYAQSAKQIQAWPDNHFAVQLMSANDVARITAFRAKLPKNLPTTVYRRTVSGKPGYVLVSGSYASRALAQKKLAGLPAEVKKEQPWIKSVVAINQELSQ